MYTFLLTCRKSGKDSFRENLHERVRRSDRQETVKPNRIDNALFHFDSSADRFSRPPSATSLHERALSPTNDFTNVFPPQRHILTPNVRPIQVWQAQ